jgi:hypothetical protein
VTPENARLVRLRGGLAAVEVGARGIESVARNTACTRLRAIVIAGLTPNEVIKAVFNAEGDAMSPFAMTLTQNFERRLLGNGGSSLLTAYREKGLLAPDEVKITSVEDMAPGDRPMARSRRVSETQRLLDLKHAGDPRAPNLILSPRLMLEIVGVSLPPSAGRSRPISVGLPPRRAIDQSDGFAGEPRPPEPGWAHDDGWPGELDPGDRCTNS